MLTIDLWSDVVCPWCWIAEHRLDRALQAEGLEAQWRFHAFELWPREQKREPILEHLAHKYHVSLEEAGEMTARVQGLGRELGLDINPAKQRTTGTFDAHRLVAAAQVLGQGRAVMERLRRAHFSEGRPVGDPAELEALAVEAGMDAAEAKRVLSTDAYAMEVEEDLRRAAAYEIRGVPFTVLNGRLAVQGAQPIEAFRDALRQAAGLEAG